RRSQLMARPARVVGISALCGILLYPSARLGAEPVTVRYAEGLVHGFLTLRTLEGQSLADGDLLQVPRGDQLTTILRFRFHDGSLYEDTVTYAQRRRFRLLSEHTVQRGPSFPRELESRLDARSGAVHVRYRDEDDKQEKTLDERMALPED